MDIDARSGRPLVAHVIVSLCDNKYQGIVKVPSHLGNGQSTRGNLYWAARYGVKSYLLRAGWQKIEYSGSVESHVLEKIVLHKKLTRKGRDVDAYVVAEAWDGQYIKNATIRFLNLASGGLPERIVMTKSGKSINAGGASQLLCYIGHNGLMDFSIPGQPKKNRQAGPRSGVVLACCSKSYFAGLLDRAGCDKLVLTNNFMAPEAYTLDAIVNAWFSGRSPDAVRKRAALAYAKYQKCSPGGARRLFGAHPKEKVK